MTADTPQQFDARVAPLNREQRTAQGKALRARASRESHADFAIDPARDPLPILTATDSARMPSLLGERYKRMAPNPFTFYRGAAALMAHDLAALPRIGLPVQACGDCHLMNFGAFASPEGNVLFDINDFDETCPGVDFVVDLKRLAASVAVAAQAASMTDKKAQALAAATVAAYREFMNDLADRSPLEIWQTRMDLKDQVKGFGNAELESEILGDLLKSTKKGKRSSEHPKFVADKDGVPSFVDDDPVVFHVASDGERADQVFSSGAFARYKATLASERAMLLDHYVLGDVAFKVVGVGSVGTRCAVGLMMSADGEEIILQLKEALPSVVAGLAAKVPSVANQGQRVVDGQRALQAASDIFLGWTQDEDGHHVYLRQLKNRRLGSIGELIEGKALPAYAALCGRTLARAHARTGDAAMIAGYIGDSPILDQALAAFAMSYSSQTVLDHAKLVASPLVPPPSPAPGAPAKSSENKSS